MDKGLEHLYIDLVYMNHRKQTPDWKIDRERSIGFIDVTYVVAGEATYIVDGETYTVGAGDLICVPMGSDRQAVGNESSPIESYCINFLAYDGRDLSRIVMPLPVLTHIGIHTGIIQLFAELYMSWLLREEGYRLQCAGYALLILSRLIEQAKNDPSRASADPRIRRIVRHIAEHPDDTLTAAALASIVGLHPVYFSSLFRKNMGVSVGSYVRSIRVNRAEILLSEGACSVSEAASLCGFCDVYHFSRVFKKLRGIPPSEILKRRVM